MKIAFSIVLCMMICLTRANLDLGNLDLENLDLGNLDLGNLDLGNLDLSVENLDLGLDSHDFSCNTDACCSRYQRPNTLLGIEFLQFDPLCLTEAAGLHCIGDTGCSYCVNDAEAQDATTPSNCPVCRRYRPNSAPCTTQECCSLLQNANPNTGCGFLELNTSCTLNVGNIIDLLFSLELPCVADTACSLCFLPVVGGINIGNKPICNFGIELGVEVEESIEEAPAPVFGLEVALGVEVGEEGLEVGGGVGVIVEDDEDEDEAGAAVEDDNKNDGNGVVAGGLDIGADVAAQPAGIEVGVGVIAEDHDDDDDDDD